MATAVANATGWTSPLWLFTCLLLWFQHELHTVLSVSDRCKSKHNPHERRSKVRLPRLFTLDRHCYPSKQETQIGAPFCETRRDSRFQQGCDAAGTEDRGGAIRPGILFRGDRGEVRGLSPGFQPVICHQHDGSHGYYEMARRHVLSCTNSGQRCPIMTKEQSH